MQPKIKIFLVVVAVSTTIVVLSTIMLTSNGMWLHVSHWLHAPLETEQRFTGNWQAIIKGSDTLYGCSAYFDDLGNQSYVRVIGVSATSISRVYCDLWYSDGSFATVVGHMSEIPYNAGRRYTGIFLLCPLPTDARPHTVSIGVNKTQRASAVFPVIYYTNAARKFTVCVSALHGYKNVYEMVEMVEANRLLGADYFVFYYVSSSKDITHALNHYAKEGIVEVVQWNLPKKVSSGIHYFAQMSQMNDCMYRNLRRSKYIVTTDMDELIIPQLHGTWSEMIEYLPDSAAYFFRCVFFRKEWPNIEGTSTEKTQALKYRVQSVLKQRREKRIFKLYQRSKHIINPSLVEIAGVHDVYKYREERFTRVDPSVALLHHYRNLNNYKQYQTGIKDTRIAYFQKKLLAMIDHRWQKLNSSLTVDRS